MRVIRDEQPSRGLPPHFSGEVWFTYHSHGSPVACAKAHFAPGARIAWHRHSNGGTVYVLDGLARVGERDGAVVDLRAGESVVSDAGAWHWHGAAPGHFTTQLAVHDGTMEWGDAVTDDEYLAGPTT